MTEKSTQGSSAAEKRGVQGRPTGAERRARRAGRAAPGREARVDALLCLGYGLFLLSYCSTVPVLGFARLVLDGWAQVLLAQFAFFVASGLGCLVVRRLMRAGAAPDPRQTNVACAVAMAACLVAAYVLATPTVHPAVAALLATGLGLGASWPLVFWFNGLCAVYRDQGRRACIMVLAGSGLVAVAAALLAAPFAGNGAALFGVLLAVVVACAACRARISALWGMRAGSPDAWASRSERYRLTAYSVATLASLGLTVGLTGSFLVLASVEGEPGGLSEKVAMLAPVAMFGAVVLLCRVFPRAQGPRFGLIARVLIAVAGVALALLPVLLEVAPGAALPLFKVVFALQGVVMMLFSVEVSCENGLHVLTVMPVNYAFYSLVAAVGAGLFWLVQTYVGGRLAWELIAAAGMAATALVIPMLPSASSNAAAFTLRELPENEGYERRIARTCEELAREHGLTVREAEVLGMLLHGMSRQEIAEELTLSAWTVKDHASNVYKKVGVHSCQELLELVRKGGQG